MLIDPEERVLVSSLGWVDGGALWTLETASGVERSVQIGDADFLSLHAGRSGHFAAVHRDRNGGVVITAHCFDEPGQILGRCLVSATETRCEGSASAWRHLPRHYVAFLDRPSGSHWNLVTLEPPAGAALQSFDWFDQEYDTFWQAILGVTEIPGSHLVLVSVQRSSRPILYDPEARRRVGELVLAERLGNPNLYFARTRPELWADDYDVLLKLETGTWRVLKSRRLQGSPRGTRHFIGQFAFTVDEALCAVARPASGDVIGLDPEDLGTRYRAQVGGQPLEVAVLRDGSVYARDWQSGELLRGSFRRAPPA